MWACDGSHACLGSGLDPGEQRGQQGWRPRGAPAGRTLGKGSVEEVQAARARGKIRLCHPPEASESRSTDVSYAYTHFGACIHKGERTERRRFAQIERTEMPNVRSTRPYLLLPG